MIRKIKEFIQEVRQEMAKVSWPTFPELRSSTAIVIVMSVILAIFLFLVDRGLSKIMEGLLR